VFPETQLPEGQQTRDFIAERGGFRGGKGERIDISHSKLEVPDPQVERSSHGREGMPTNLANRFAKCEPHTRGEKPGHILNM